MSAVMKAMVLTGHGDLDRLVWREDLLRPEAGAGEVLIKVGACGLNNTDVNTRTAWYSKGTVSATSGRALEGADEKDGTWSSASIQFPRIQGADIAGHVVASGAGVDPSLNGRRVMIDPWMRDRANPLDMDKARYLGSEFDGGFAEYVLARADTVHPVECALSDAELATFATSYVTAENMLNRAHVAKGDVVLIPGASGGVGSALVQLVKRRGAAAIAMCSPSKAEAVRAAGADVVLERSPDNLAAALHAATGRSEVDVVADIVGGPEWPKLIAVIARNGRYTCAGAIAGPLVPFDLRTFYLRDLTFTGATVVPEGTFADLVGYIERGEIRPLLAATFALKDLHAAQTAFMAKNHVGNIVVVP